MKTSVLNQPARSTDQTRTQSTQDYWTEALRLSDLRYRRLFETVQDGINDSDRHLAAPEFANSTKDAWLIARSQDLRTPLMTITSMLGLMESGHKLASVRPLYEQPSEFDETAFQQIQMNFLRVVHFFNELAARTGQSPLQLESSPPPATETSLAASINPANGEL
jgi:hypothetical protein